MAGWLIMAIGIGGLVQYFQAVQEGKRRAGASQMRLFKIAGFAMLTITTKKIDGKFVPVGEQDMAAVIQNKEGFVAIIVDEDGFTKAQTKPVPREEAASIFKGMLEAGIDEFTGREVEIWTETYPVVRDGLR